MIMLWPNGTTTRPPITSPFGRRPAPVAGASTTHRGTDFVGYSRIRAIAAGRVVRVGTPDGWSGGGVQVWIQHDGFLTRSMHMVKGSPVVEVGEWVEAGDELGEMGATGNVSGKHHHLEVVVNGVQIDPVPFITSRIAGPTGGAFSPEEDDMDAEQDQRLKNIENAVLRYIPQADGNKVIQPRTDDLAVWLGIIMDMIRSLPGGADVDEDALAAALAPKLVAHLPAHTQALTDDDLARIAKSVADEQARRQVS